MNITYTWRNADKTEALEELVSKKLERIERHFDRIINIHVTFDTINNNHEAKAVLHVPGEEINAHATESDMYKAIDNLVHKLLRQVDEYKEKIKNHRD